MNDDICIEAMMRRGFTKDDALDFAITGCVDLLAPGKTGGIGFAAILLSRVLDMTLRNGDSQIFIGTVANVGPKTGDPDTFTSFDQLVDAFIVQASSMIQTIVECVQPSNHSCLCRRTSSAIHLCVHAGMPAKEEGCHPGRRRV